MPTKDELETSDVVEDKPAARGETKCAVIVDECNCIETSETTFMVPIVSEGDTTSIPIGDVPLEDEMSHITKGDIPTPASLADMTNKSKTIMITTPVRIDKEEIKKKRNREAHIERVNKLTELGFSKQACSWILDWAFHADNKLLIRGVFLPMMISKIAAGIMAPLQTIIATLKKEGTEETITVYYNLKFAETKLLRDFIAHKKWNVVIKRKQHMKKGSLGDVFSSEFDKLNL